MDKQHSTEVIERYKQEKINKSVFSRIQSLLWKFDEDDRRDRQIAWIGLGILTVLLVIAFYLFSKV